MKKNQNIFILFLYVMVSMVCEGTVCSAAEDLEPSVVYNDLTEVFARKTYENQKPADLLYNESSLQSELLHFYDTEYGTRIWKVSNSYNTSTLAHNHINRSPWNSNGSRLGLISSRYFPPYWSSGVGLPGDPHLYLVDTTGDNFVSIDEFQNSPPGINNGGTRFRHFVWDREVPEYTYFAAYDGLYRLDITNFGSYVRVANFPNEDRRKIIYSYPSEENIVMVIDDLANRYESPHFYFVDLKKSIDDPTQVISYPIAYNLVDWPDHDVAKEYSFHDIYFTRQSNGSYAFDYGPVAGLGEPVFFKAPLDGNVDNVELWYDQLKTDDIPYHSHPAWGPDGKYTSYFGEQYPARSNKWGWHVADDLSKQHIKQLTNVYTGGHIAWDGYDEDLLCAAVRSREGERKILKATLSGPENNAVAFVNPYSSLNDDEDGYHTIPRPAQSPDATKLFYHSSMTEVSDAFVDSYIAVIRYPFPAKNVRLKNDAELVIEWEKPLFHRETKGYHVYRSVGNVNTFNEITSSAIPELEFTDAGLKEGEVYYYAVTSEEWSGLESDKLSNIIKVILSEGRFLYENVEEEGREDFDKIFPASVENTQWILEKEGVYKISWDNSIAKDLSYYNIYYSVEGVPEACPQRLIASVPKTQFSYIDWQARMDAEGFYLVTAVDRHGNESKTISLDINGDGSINVQDVILCVNIILGTANGNADVNKDGQVNVQDVIAIVNEILDS